VNGAFAAAEKLNRPATNAHAAAIRINDHFKRRIAAEIIYLTVSPDCVPGALIVH